MNLKFFLLFVSCIYVVHIKIIHRMVFLHIIWVVIKRILTEASKRRSHLRTFLNSLRLYMKSKLKKDTHLKLKELELASSFVVLHHSSHRLVSYGV